MWSSLTRGSLGRVFCRFGPIRGFCSLSAVTHLGGGDAVLLQLDTSHAIFQPTANFITLKTAVPELLTHTSLSFTMIAKIFRIYAKVRVRDDRLIHHLCDQLNSWTARRNSEKVSMDDVADCVYGLSKWYTPTELVMQQPMNMLIRLARKNIADYRILSRVAQNFARCGFEDKSFIERVKTKCIKGLDEGGSFSLLDCNILELSNLAFFHCKFRVKDERAWFPLLKAFSLQLEEVVPRTHNDSTTSLCHNAISVLFSFAQLFPRNEMAEPCFQLVCDFATKR